LLSVIVPLRNERNTVCEVLRRMRTVALPMDREIIVVDDASDDGTDKVLAALEDSTIRVIGHPTQLGRSAALHTGLAAARGDLVLFQDPDLRYTPEDWPALMAPVLAGRAEAVYGSRFLDGREFVSMGQWVSEHLVGLVASLLFNRTITDLDATKLVDRAALGAVGLLGPRGKVRFDFNPEVTARLLRDGHRISEVPVRFAGHRSRIHHRTPRRERLTSGLTLLRLRFRAYE
jgi:glycosyltransferase involved in cell wall biosynthesis